ncbi:hypothetical protein [Bremerella sp.]|uniref:hypothetical protein n=1 Tax=Bremerella sp. TaxID=2795602 RepID=UPI003919746B
MILGIAVAVVGVLLVVALLPAKKRDETLERLKPTSETNALRSQPRDLRTQQLEEEATAIAEEYRRKADEVWLEEVRTKASTLLGPPKRTTSKS